MSDTESRRLTTRRPVERIEMWVRARGDKLPDCAHWAAIVSAFLFLVVINRNRWFDTDEWSPLIDRRLFGGPGKLGLFQPHNEHWSTIPFLLYRFLFSLFALHTYIPYMIMVIVAHLVVVQLLWLLLRRLGVDPWIALVAVAAVAFMGAGVDDIVLPFQVSFDISLAAGLGALLLLPERGRWVRRDLFGWGLLVVALASSGIGLTMTIVVVVAQLLRRGWRVALATLSVPAVVYLVWWVAYGKDAVTPGQEPVLTAVQSIPLYVWRGFTEPVSSTLGFAGAGTVVIVVLAVWVMRRGRLVDGPWPIVLSAAFGAAAFLALTDIRRVQLGVDQASATRYAYVTLVLLVPAAALAVQALVQRGPLLPVIVAGGLALLLLVGIPAIQHDVHLITLRQRDQEGRILATAQLARTTRVFLYPAPVPVYIPNLTVEKIHQLDVNGDLPSWGITPKNRLDALAYVQVFLGRDMGLRAQLPPAIVSGSEVTLQPGAAGCTVVTADGDTPKVVLRAGGPSSVLVESQRTGTLELQLARDGAAGTPRPFNLTGYRATHLNLNVPGTDVDLTVPPLGSTTLCGVARSGV